MKISEKVRKWWIPVLAVLLVVPCLNFMRSRAAGGIDLERECSLTVSVDIIRGTDGSNDSWLEDFNRMRIPVSVYKVADVDVTGQDYTPEEAFGELDLEDLSSDHLAESTAARWRELAEQAERKGAQLAFCRYRRWNGSREEMWEPLRGTGGGQMQGNLGTGEQRQAEG